MRTIIAIIITVSFLHACEFMPNGMKGNGKVINKDFEVTTFNGIDVSGSFDVYLKKGTGPEVRIMADENLFPHIKVIVDNNMLKINSRKNFWKYKSLKVFITYENLSVMDISGGVDLIAEDKIISDDFVVRFSGGSDGKIKLEANKLILDLSGGADLDVDFRGEEVIFNGSGGSDADLTIKDAVKTNFTLSGGADADVIGSAEFANISCSGGSDFNGLGFKLSRAIVEATGAGDARVYVSDEITLRESGAGSVRFEGGAKIVDK
jgi:hypothetical protein